MTKKAGRAVSPHNRPWHIVPDAVCAFLRKKIASGSIYLFIVAKHIGRFGDVRRLVAIPFLGAVTVRYTQREQRRLKVEVIPVTIRYSIDLHSLNG